MFVLFILVVAPVLFFLLAWVTVTTCRLYFPDRSPSFGRSRTALWERQKEAMSKEALGDESPVGVREIRENQRRYFREHVGATYHYVGGGSSGSLPSDWMEDLWRRRN